MKPVKDIHFKIGKTYIVTAYKFENVTCRDAREEWECKKISPQGGVKFKDANSGEKFWVLPTYLIEVFDFFDTDEDEPIPQHLKVLTKEEILNKNDWKIECESPFEIRHKDGGAFASGLAADIVLDYYAQGNE